MFVAVLLLACLDPTNHATCVSIPVTDTAQEQIDGSEISITGCMGLQGALSAKRYWEEHKDLHEKFHFGGWRCQIGNRQAVNKGQA